VFFDNSGATGFDRTDRRLRGMPRITVGLDKKPLQFLTGNYQYKLAA
jgi:hypothetical protein